MEAYFIDVGGRDAAACNYNAMATMDNAACVYAITENLLTSSNWVAESGFTCGDPQTLFGVFTFSGSQNYLVFNADYTGEMFQLNGGSPTSVSTFTWSIVGCEVITSVDLGLNIDGFAVNANGDLVTFFNESANVPSCYNVQWAPFQEIGCAEENACNYVDPAPDYNSGCSYPAPFQDCDGNCIAPDLTDTSWDLYSGSPFALGELQEANAVTFNDGGTATNQTATGFAVDSWTQNCATISFSNNEPTIQFAQVTLYDSGMIQVRYLDNGSLIDRVLVPSGSVIGCTNVNACNYDATVTIDDPLACVFPQGQGYDCDGNCTVTFDVSGTTWDVYSAINTDNTLEGMVSDELVMSNALTLEESGAVSGEFFPVNNTWTQDCGGINLVDDGDNLNFITILNNGGSLFYSSFNQETQEQSFYLLLPVASDTGCTDDTACNYDAAATTDDGSCTYPEAGQDCDGNCVIEGTYLYVFGYDCSQYTPFEVTEANSPGAIASYELIFDGNGGVILNEFIIGQGFFEQTTTYTYDNCVLNIQGFGDFEPQLDGSFLAATENNPDVCSAIFEGTIGCIDQNACNYDPNAYADAGAFIGGLCEYPTWGADCDGNCLVTFDISGTTWDVYDVPGWDFTEESIQAGELLSVGGITFNADNSLSGAYYEPGATWEQDCGLIRVNYEGELFWDAATIRNNGEHVFAQIWDFDNQEYNVYLLLPSQGSTGCTDNTACNFDASATETDNSLCTYPSGGFDCDGNLLPVLGCTYENADNYNAEANDDDGSCIFSPAPILGCTNQDAANYHPAATEDDGSCLFGDILSCPGDFNDDGAINSGDLLVFLGVFGTTCEQNLRKKQMKK